MLEIPLSDVDREELTALITRHERARKGGIEIINALGTQAEGLLGQLPEPVRRGLDGATRLALEQAVRAAAASRSVVGDPPGWVNQVLGAGLGAAGGVAGSTSALAELPITTTLLLRVIQGVATEYEFDPKERNVQFDCISVLASAGPLSDDDDVELAFVSARLGLTGTAMQKVVQLVAPKLAAALGQKLAAQAVPLLGAAAGAAINYAYVNYYREMAHVRFGLRRLSIDADVSEDALLEAFRSEVMLLRKP